MLNHCGRFTQERRLQRGRNDLPRRKLWGSYQSDISPGPLTSAIHASADEMGPTCLENGTFWRPPELALARPGPAGSCHLSLPHTLRSLWAPEPHCHEPRKDTETGPAAEGGVWMLGSPGDPCARLWAGTVSK